jgi:putative spermidine/putrescine transport system permease protein
METIGGDKGLARGVTLALACSILVFLMAPMLVVFPVSVTDQRFLAFPRHAISFAHYGKVLTGGGWMNAIGQSLVIAVASTAVSVVVGTLCAIGCWRLASRFSELVRVLILAPIVIPSIVYTLGIYKFYVDVGLLDSYLGVILAHTVTGLAYPVITVSAALAGFDVRLEQAARTLGASLGQTTWRIIVPNVTPGVLSGAIFAFIHSWDETVMVLFIAGRTVYTLPRRIWNDINENLDPAIAAVAVMLIGVTFLFLLAELALKARRAKP